MTRVTLAQALASFQRTLISDWSPYDRYVAGDEGALDPETQGGMFLFAEAGCAECHAPPRFESERYARRVPSIELGRASVTELAEDEGAFRVPTLRNVRETEPYFHDGRAATLGEAVTIEVQEQVAQGRSRAMSEQEIGRIVRFLDKALMDRSREPDRPGQVPSGLPVPIDGFRFRR